MLFINWMRSYRYREEINRHWSIFTFKHKSEDDKTICEERALIDDLFFWISSIVFTRDEIKNHLSRFFLIFDSDFYLYQSTFAVCSSKANWIQTIYSFESCFNQIRVASQSEQSRSSHISQVVKFYNDVKFWITESIRRTTNHNHKQKKRRFEERTSHAKNNNLKKTQFQRLWSLKAISKKIWWIKRSEIRHCRFEDIKRISCLSSYL
jgi:hypothetical protein